MGKILSKIELKTDSPKFFPSFTSIILTIFLLALSMLTACALNINQNTSSNGKDTTNSENADESLSINDLNYFDNRIIVGYISEEHIDSILKLLSGEVILKIPQIRALSIKIAQPVSVVIEKLRNLGNLGSYGIRYVEPSYKRYLTPVSISALPTAANLSKSSLSGKNVNNYTNYTGESLDLYLWGQRAIRLKYAWEQGYYGNGVIVAVLDTGVDGTHPDLLGQTVTGYRPLYDMEIPAGIDCSYGGSHGTHVAGIIVAKKDGKGIVGVASNAKVMPIIIFDHGGWYVGDEYAARGIIWAVEHGAKVLSNSWGGMGYSQVLKDAFDYALENNVTIVVAAGNSTSSQSFFYPANYPGVIQVGAAEFNGGNIKTAYFSNGSPMITVSAPGRDILSTMPQNFSYGYDQNSFKIPENDGYYGFMSGTSMATPYVSGVVTLILQKFPDAKPWQVRKLIEKSAFDIDSYFIDERSGYGLLQISAIDFPLPFNLGSNIFVEVSDHYGSWKLSSVFISFLGVSKDGRKIRYFAKTNKDGIAKFLNVEQGTYEIIIGGPDNSERARRLNILTFRSAEERQYKTVKSISSELYNLNVKFSSSAVLNISQKPQQLYIAFEKIKDDGSKETERIVDFSNIAQHRFSKLSGKYCFKAYIPLSATENIKIEGNIELNGIVIPVSGVIPIGATETLLRDSVSTWWTLFGNDND